MESRVVRDKFLSFFKSKAHEIVASAPLVIKNDPTLMFTNAGMNQFKDIFLGTAPAKFKRIANSQKCLRVSGKHNDLEEVGVDTYHHTMFEMLGNWSFGDYFKKEAIEWSYELLVKEYQLDPDRIYVTVFEGSKEDNIPFDQESFDTWKKFFNEDRILNGNKKDNFWEMGETGPCGPCSEIHIDLRDEGERKKIPGRDLVNTGHPLVVEVWNNVFMEFNRKADGSLVKLPQQHVDTCMGFERLCMTLQNKKSNYDTDVFQPVIKALEKISNKKYTFGKTTNEQEKINIAFRVIADHIRAISFAIADGQLPGNTGAGYVIRRILRRAIRYGYQTLELRESFIFSLVNVLQETMGDAYPELVKQGSLIEKVIKEEETSFYRTLENGIKRIETHCEEMVKNGKKVISGKVVFELYDTFGFPLDLTSLIARGYELSIDENEFEKELEIQKDRSRKATAVEAADWIEVNQVNVNSVFTGYENLIDEAVIVKYRNVKGKNKNFCQIVLSKTPFYAESGGQVGDTGILENGKSVLMITDTKKELGEIIHFTDPIENIDLKGSWSAKVDAQKRVLTESNHSATHLLHAALRKVLGTHVEQKGSLVNDAYLRFDFSHFAKVSDDELQKIEDLVNEKIRENIASSVKEMKLDDARKLGAMALFGEKYGEQVRVVEFDKSYSIELCGGTHVKSTSQIGLIKITAESAVAAGIRRIEAITSVSASNFINEQLKQFNELKSLLKNPKDISKAVIQLQDEIGLLRKQNEQLNKEKAKHLKVELINAAKKIGEVNVICSKVNLNAPDALKDLVFELKSTNNYFIVLANEMGGKPSLSVAISDNLVKTKNLNAASIVKELAKEINGGGGGQNNYATAGGSNSAGIDKALNKAINFIQ